LAFRQIRERTRFLRGLTDWVGFKSVGIQYSAARRRSGETKYGFRQMILLALNGIVSFSAYPLYFAIYLGFTLAALGSLYLFYAFYMRFVSREALPGWTSIITWVAITSGIQLLVLGIIGVYIAKIYEETKQRPLYLISQQVGFDRTS
jgi:hypothetical protein